jgi:hypothetical protein
MSDVQSIDDLMGAIGPAMRLGEVRAYPEQIVAAAGVEKAPEPLASEGAIRA